MHAKQWRRAFLSASQEKEIEARVAAFEKKTGTEVKIAVLRESSQYHASRWYFSALLTVLGFHLFTLRYGWAFDDVSLLILNVLALFPVFFLTRLKLIKRIVATKQVRGKKVKEKAFATFHRLGIHETHHRCSSLIFISIFEKSFELMLDKGLAPHFSKDELDKLTLTMRGHFKEGNFDSGLRNCIEALERKLSEKNLTHPPAASNELSNAIYWGHSS